jgi:hypothetical protein
MSAASTNGDRGASPGEPVDEVRGTREQGLAKDANDRIVALPNRPPAVFELFICECRLAGCADTVSLTVEEYERIHTHPDRYAVAPGHLDPAIERVVDSVTGRFEVVEMDGQAGEAAAQAGTAGA